MLTAALLDFFQVAYTPAEIAAMRATAQFHAKEPEVLYVDDSAAKRRATSAAAQDAAERWLSPLYAQLEALRCADSGSF